MSCPNFKHMLYGLPMIVSRTYKQMAQEYDEDFDDDLYGLLIQEDFSAAQDLAESFSGLLKYHTVSVEGGYYEGFQFYVEELYASQFDLDTSSAYCIDNDEAHYYFDECRSKALRNADAEKRKIERWLKDRAKNGFNHIVCRGAFSNGEAIYDFA